MKSTELYKIVYLIVKKALKNDDPKFETVSNMYAWAQLIPASEGVREKMADALCTSVSQSTHIGLESFFKECVYLEDLSEAINNKAILERLKDQLNRKDADGKSYTILGQIIRDNFKGRLTLNEEDQVLLESIKA